MNPMSSTRRARTPPPRSSTPRTSRASLPARARTPPPGPVGDTSAVASIDVGISIKCTWTGGVAIRRTPDYDDKLGETVQRDEVVLVEEKQGTWIRFQTGWVPLVRQSNSEPMFQPVARRNSSIPRNSSIVGDPWAVPNSSSPGENVQVFARFRPVADIREDEETCVEYGDDGCSCTLNHDKQEKTFHFSRVFHPWANQDDVFDAVARPVVASVSRGFNGAILAYGQTGSGKTHTMVGPSGAKDLIEGRFESAENGIIPRALLELQAFAAPSAGAVKLRVSYIEVYQEKVLDLLSPEGKFICNNVRQDAARGLWLPEVTEMPVQGAHEAMEIMKTGNQHRAKAATDMNSDSSRSHAIFIVTLENHLEPGKVKFAQLYLVDLAGSERISKAHLHGTVPDSVREEIRTRMEETKLINQSLLALGQVISALSSNQTHVPYRDSKLTRILQNCLGGNAKTSIIVTASPLAEHGHVSLSTLGFGDRAAKIKNIAKVNVSVSPAELKKELQKVRDEVLELRGVRDRLERENGLLRANHWSSHTTAPSRESHPPGETTIHTPTSEPAIVDALSSATTDSTEESVKLMAQRLLMCELLPTLICPLTNAVMRDPVFAMDGYTYERSAIEQHMKNSGRMPAMSPMAGRPFASKAIVPNPVVKQLIQRHLPDLPPLQVKVPALLRVGMHKQEIILSFLNGVMLGRSRLTCTCLLATGSGRHLWAGVLAAEFPSRCPKDQPSSDSSVDMRKTYIAAFNELHIKVPQVQEPCAPSQGSKGLKLLSPVQRIKAK